MGWKDRRVAGQCPSMDEPSFIVLSRLELGNGDDGLETGSRAEESILPFL